MIAAHADVPELALISAQSREAAAAWASMGASRLSDYPAFQVGLYSMRFCGLLLPYPS